MATKGGIPRFRQGDLILSEEPFVFTVSINQVDSRCHNCLTDISTDLSPETSRGSLCSACRYTRYCSVKCQKSDWKSHKLECQSLKLLAASGFRPPEHFMLMLKILLKSEVTFGKAGLCEPAENSFNRTFNDLVSHKDDLLKDTEVMEYTSQIRLILAKYLGITNPFDLPPHELILEIFGKVKCNSYSILDNYMMECGVGLYLNGSAFDHSCQPNACQVFDGSRLFIRALEDIPSLDKVRISYVDRLYPAKIRNEALLDGYFFTCSCERCLDLKADAEMFSLKCANVSCVGMIAPDERATEPCSSCGSVISDVEARLKFWNTMVDPNSKGRSDMSTSDASDILDKLKDTLHPMNPLLASACAEFGSCTADTGAAASNLDHATKVYRFWYPFPSVDPLMGVTFFKAANAFYLKDPAEAGRKMTEAERILLLTHGQGHSLYKQIPEQFRL